ncbi:GtrA family protein [Streptomyces termitum]|uniref:GtrA family protein n=1 Tax=Streptomyces termitum TaxID=67368 RepID=UPI0033BA8A91
MALLTGWGRRLPSWLRNIWQEVAAFGIVGALAFVVEIVGFNLLVFGLTPSGDGALRGSPVLASSLATLLAMVVSWVGNRYWTYRDRRGPIDLREVTLFVGVNLAGMVVTAIPVYLSHTVLGLGSPLSDNIARLVGWAAATVLRFVAYRTLVFTSADASAEAAAAKDATPVPGTVDRSTASLRGAWRSGRLWPWCLAVLAAFCGYCVATVFHPGYVTTDSIDQLRQALGDWPVNDWHPPVMALLWRVLIATTGSFSAMAALQAAVLWGALWLLARVVWLRTRSHGLSLAMLAVGLAPHIVNFTGVVWKDVHMAYAMLAVLALALTARELPAGRTRTRWVLFGLGALLLAYCVLVRKNGLPAVIPVFALLVMAVWPSPGRRRWLVTSGLLVAVTAVGSVGVSAITQPIATKQVAQLPLDDLLHVLTPAQVGRAAEKAGATDDFRDRLVTAATRCQTRKIASDAYFMCYPRERPTAATTTELGEHSEVLFRMWTQQMPKHWKGYLEYRTRVYAKLMFQSNQQFQSGHYLSPGMTLPEPVAKAPYNETLRQTLQAYVTGALRDLSMIYQGWFWTAVALVLLLRRRWAGPYTRELRLLGASTVLYMLAYFPTAPQSNYRYLYWPAVSGTVALLLVAVGYAIRRREARQEAAEAAGNSPEPAEPAAGPAQPREAAVTG